MGNVIAVILASAVLISPLLAAPGNATEEALASPPASQRSAGILPGNWRDTHATKGFAGASEDSTKTANGFKYFTWTSPAGGRMPFRLYVPNVTQGKQYPLLTYFHGSGSRGDDNTAQLNYASVFLTPQLKEEHPSFVLACQCPKDRMWTVPSRPLPSEMTPELALAMEIYDWVLDNYPVDRQRVYVYGQSMGGYATWELISRYPDRFAAAVPVCGGGDEAQADKIKNIPVWAFHGALDPTVKVERSRTMIAAMKTAGGVPQYTEYPDVKHNAWDFSYKEDGLLHWLFSKVLPAPADSRAPTTQPQVITQPER